MINIRKGRYVNEIANWWLGVVKDHLTKPRHVYVTLGNNKRKYFKSYEEKIRYQCFLKIFAEANDKRRKRLWLAQLDDWWKNLDKIILVEPDEMAKQVNKWNKKKTEQTKLLNAWGQVFVDYYEIISNFYGNELVEKLNIKTCPYCNRQFIYTFKGRAPERPELDHFFPKSEYPLYCLSFYNLIPSCHSCNHVKSNSLIGVNPYDKAFNGRFIITDNKGRKLSNSKIYKLTEKEIRLDFEDDDADEEINETVLGLKDVYNKHKDYVKELIDKSMAYDKNARDVLVNSFQSAGYNPRQVYDFVWGRHLMDAQYEDRPLSKLTKEVLDLLDIERG